MCGRYQRRADKQKITEAFQLGNVDGLHLELAPDDNVAPQTMQPVVIWDEHFDSRTLHMHRRCLVPIASFVEWRTEGKSKLPWIFGMDASSEGLRRSSH